MPRRNRRVVAIGIDAAELTLIQQLIQSNALPHLAELFAHGVSGRVASPSDIGSGAVWPTFSTGTSPVAHGICSFWDWDAQSMQVAPVAVEGLRPFWQDVARAGYAVGVLDVPFTAPVGLVRGIEIVEWGPHDAVRRRTDISPPALRDLVLTAGGRHPFSVPPLDAWGKVHDAPGRDELVADCLAGIEQRGALAVQISSQLNLDLFIVVFTEVHRASHLLWHTVEPAQTESLIARETDRATSQRGLADIYRAVDRQIGRIADPLDADDAILVFSLHGMRWSNGVPDVLHPLCLRSGLAISGGWKTESWLERTRRPLAVLRRHMPATVKRGYHRLMPPALTIQVAGPPLIFGYAWARTTAFPLPTDQHGWIRVNLAGREAQGVLAQDRYDETCGHIERLLRGLVTDDGQPIVSQVLRLASTAGTPPDRLPDLVVHWNDEAIGRDSRLRSPAISVPLRATNMTGQHAPDGFFVLRARTEKVGSLGASIEATDMHRLLQRLLSPV